MVKSYTSPAVDEKWAHTQKGTKVSIPGSYWESEYKNRKLPYKGVVLVYNWIRADNGPFFPVKLVCNKDNVVDYLLFWENIVEYAYMTTLTDKINGPLSELWKSWGSYLQQYKQGPGEDVLCQVSPTCFQFPS